MVPSFFANNMFSQRAYSHLTWKGMLLTVGASLLFSCNNSKSSGKPSGQVINADQETGQDSENTPGGGSSDGRSIKKEGSVKKSSEEMNDPPTEGEAPGETVPVKAPEIPAKYGFRNFESAHSTMSALTGVAKSNAQVITAFNANKVSLLTDASAKSLTSSSVVGLYKLATTYCDELTKDTTLRAAVFGTFDFAGLPQTVLADAGKKQIAEAIVAKFWGKDLARLPPHDANVAMMTETITELLALNTANTAAVTVRVVSGSCASALMASQSMLY